MSDEPHANIDIENVEWHTFYGLLDEMEQLAKNNDSSPKPAERLLQKITHLPWLVRARCQRAISLWGRPRAVWHAEMAVYMLRMEIMGRELESAEESATTEKVELALNVFAEVKARTEKEIAIPIDQGEEEKDKGVVAAYLRREGKQYMHMLRWQVVQFSKIVSALAKIWPDV